MTMTHETPAPQPAQHRAGRFSLARLGHDYAYILPGFFLSLAGFIVLVPLLALSLGTLIVWAGALLLPVTLTIARGFAQLSRVRVRQWGAAPVPARYRPVSPGLVGWMASSADPRLWLDLVFETVIALPVRLLTFTVAVSWSAAAASGLTYVFWGAFLPDEGPGALAVVLDALFGGALPASVTDSFALEALWHFLLGALFLLSLPTVIHALARLDATITIGALASAGTSSPDGTSADRTVGADSPTPAHRHGSAHPLADADTLAPAESDVPAPTAVHQHDGLPPAWAWAWLTAGFAAAVLLAVSWPVTVVVYGVPVVLALAVTLVHSAALIAAVRWPVMSTIAGTAAVAAMALAAGDTVGLPWPWPVTTLITAALLVLMLALRHPWPYTVSAWVAGVAASVVAALLLRTDGLAGAIDSVLIAGPVTAGVAVLGISIRQLVRSRARLRRAEEASAQESAQRRELAERNRIAQELHDVVAHSMSVISVQATTAVYRLPDVGDDSAEEFASIAASSRRALNEMRGLLTILRGSDDALLVPQPTLQDVPALLDATRQSGTRITVGTDTAASGLPTESSPEALLETAATRISTATALTSYRILQEALSNAVRHAPGADITVTFGLTDSHLTLEVENGPARDAVPPHAPQPPASEPPRTGAGLGLTGIRERAAALSGTVDADPRPDGGFAVHARLPTL